MCEEVENGYFYGSYGHISLLAIGISPDSSMSASLNLRSPIKIRQRLMQNRCKSLCQFGKMISPRETESTLDKPLNERIARDFRR
jgi:hypothetical protein